MTPTPLNRRRFLQQGGLAGAALAFGALAPRSWARKLGANDRIRIGIVGFADRTRDTLLPALKLHQQQANLEIVGVSDLWARRRDEAAAWCQQHFGAKVATYRNNEELYEKAKPDAVVIATADFQHALHTIEAVQAGCDVYVEKPFAETMADARLARAAVQDSDRIVQIGSQRRSGASYRAAFDYLQSGQFGPIVAAEMTWNVNQPGRWRRPALVAALRESDIDWKRFILNRPAEAFDPRRYIEYRLFWPYSSGIPGQWMCHQIDTIHWFTGLPHPRSVSANGGIYLWQDGRTNFDTLTAVFDYGPLDGSGHGFQVVYSSRFTNSAGGTKEIYFSNGGELNLDTRQVTPNGALTEEYASAMNMPPNAVEPLTLPGDAATTAANTGVDAMTSAHVRNWLDCLRSREQPNAPVEAGYQHSIACIMANAAARTGSRATFDPQSQEVLINGKPFLY
jgi:predicted dehydrogenase